MTITIKEKNNGATTYFTTVAPTASPDKITGAFFDENSFDLETKPIWVSHKPATTNGNYKNYLSKDEGKMNVILHLTGTTRFENLQTWRNLSGTVFYFNSDVDSNLNGNYVYTGTLKPKYLPTQRRIEVRCTWEQFSNG